MKGAPPGPLPDEEARLKSLLERPFAPVDPMTRTDILIAVGLTLAAFLLRGIGLGHHSLWVDEGASLLFARADWSYLWTVLPQVETNPPGYYMILKLWTQLAGTSEAALRMPGVLASSLAVTAVYLAGHRAFGRGAAIVAATFLALSAVQVLYAQEARAYAFLTLFFALGLWLVNLLVDRLATGGPLGAPLVGLVVTTAALPNLHFSGFFVALVLLVYALSYLGLRGLLQRRAMVAVGGGVLAVAALSIPPVVWSVGHIGSPDNPAGWMHPPTLSDGKWVFHQAFGHRFLSFDRPLWLPDQVPEGAVGKLFAPRRLAEGSLLVVCLFGLWKSLRQKFWSVPAIGLALAALGALFFGVSQAKPVLIERTILFGVPMIALIAGYSVMAMRYSYFVLPAAVVIFVAQTANLVAYYPAAQKEDWRQAIQAMQADAGPKTAIVLASGPYLPVSVSTAVLLEHYWTAADMPPVYALPSTEAGRLYEAGMSLSPDLRPLTHDRLCPALQGYDRLLVLYRFPSQAEAIETPLAALNSSKTGGAQRDLLGHQLRSGVTCTQNNG